VDRLSNKEPVIMACLSNHMWQIKANEYFTLLIVVDGDKEIGRPR